MRKWLFILLALVAPVAGIGIAELQIRLTAEDAEATAATLPDPDPDVVRIAAHANAFTPSYDIRKAAHADCAFRLPKGSVLEWCIGDQLDGYNKISKIFESNDTTHVQSGAIVMCMDENQTLNGYDWQLVPSCYERAVISMR